MTTGPHSITWRGGLKQRQRETGLRFRARGSGQNSRCSLVLKRAYMELIWTQLRMKRCVDFSGLLCGFNWKYSCKCVTGKRIIYGRVKKVELTCINTGINRLETTSCYCWKMGHEIEDTGKFSSAANRSAKTHISTKLSWNPSSVSPCSYFESSPAVNCSQAAVVEVVDVIQLFQVSK